MAGVQNNTARQFNLKTMTPNGRRAVVRLAPGFNVVPDEHWKCFVDGKRVDKYVKRLQDVGHISFGPKVDDMELEQESSTQVKSKLEPAPPKVLNKEEAKVLNKEEAKVLNKEEAKS